MTSHKDFLLSILNYTSSCKGREVGVAAAVMHVGSN